MNKIASELEKVAKALQAGFSTTEISVDKALGLIKKYRMKVDSWSTDVHLSNPPKPESWVSVEYSDDIGNDNRHRIIVRLKNNGFMEYNEQ